MKRLRRALVFAVIAGLVWLVGLVAVGISTEDVCLMDALGSESGLTQSVRVWPPAFVCEYNTAGERTVVEHTIRGMAIVGWTYVVPLLIGAGLVVQATGSYGRIGGDEP